MNAWYEKFRQMLLLLLVNGIQFFRGTMGYKHEEKNKYAEDLQKKVKQYAQQVRHFYPRKKI